MLEILMLAMTLLLLGPALLVSLLVCGGLHLFGELAGVLLAGFAVLLVGLAAVGLTLGLVSAALSLAVL